MNLPDLTWHGFNLTLGSDFWLLLPVFLCVNLTAYLKTLGDLSLIYQGSYRKPVAVDLPHSPERPKTSIARPPS